MINRLAIASLIVCTALPVQAGSYRCEEGAVLRPNRTCSDGSLPIFSADPVRPATPAATVHPVAPAATPQVFVAPQAHVFTKAERERMMENTRREADDWVRRRHGNAAPGAVGQPTLMDQTRCTLMASQNTYVTCRQ